MKTVLVGGPKDGTIIDTDGNTFGCGYVESVYKTCGTSDVFLHAFEERYKHDDYIKHPCKKKGLTRVFKYQGRN